jgi:Domain of unknown function (DUF4349)
MKKIYCLIALTIILFISCKKAMEEDTMNMKVSLASVAKVKSPSEEIHLSNRKLVKNGSIEFETNDLNATYKKIIEKISKYNGYIFNENDSKDGEKIRKNLDLKIPNDKFDLLIAELDNEIENFDSKNISIEDVTDQYIDISARLKNKKAIEIQYLSLLKKATKISDMLAIEAKIGEIRGEIESVEGSLKALENQISFSTLNISFYKKTIGTNSFFSDLGTSLYDGWQYLLKFILLLINIWPFIIIVAILIWALKKKKIKK